MMKQRAWEYGSLFGIFYHFGNNLFFAVVVDCGYFKTMFMENEERSAAVQGCTKGVFTGKGYISVVALIGIWMVSALTSLPGLAVSPISEKLATIFPKASDLEIEMLTTLPSLLVIPFILLAGYISNRVGYIKLLYIGLVLFLLSGALYFVCGTMTQLVVVSALLGIGAGVIIPLSTALVSMFFSGKERTRQYGLVSAITNIALVVATAVVGWLADVQWRLPFLVYLLAVVPLVLVPAIRRAESGVTQDKESGDVAAAAAVADGIDYMRLVKYMLYYLLITYLVMAVSINLPFLLGEYGYDSGVSGVVVSLFFLAMMLPGLFINRLLEVVGRSVLLWAMLLIALGLLDVYFNRSLPYVITGCVAAGFGYGMAQPYIYDVTASLASAQKSTRALALLMSMNYVAIVIAPFLMEWLQDIFRLGGERTPFVINAVIGFVAALFLVLRRLYLRSRK